MPKTTVLITGAGGYIGSHVAKLFLEQGFFVVALDNFSTGYKEPLEILKKKYGNLVIVKVDLRKQKEVFQALKKYKPDTVLHLAAKCSVDESMKNPALYMENNVKGTLYLLEAMHAVGSKKMVFASTCAVYGAAQYLPMDEKHPTKPVNFYGESKLLAESLIQYYTQAGVISSVIFRFFNVCGASVEGIIGDSKRPSLLLMQNVVRGAMGLQKFELTCPKVKTRDGTPIRDYIDVEDLASAHMLGFKYLSKGKSGLFNLGNGKGFSVKEIISQVEKVLGVKIPVTKGEARKGEYAEVFADPALSHKTLGFKTKKSLRQSIESLHNWYKGHPKGYKR